MKLWVLMGMACRLLRLTLLVTVLDLCSALGKIEPSSLTAFEGTCVDIRCKFTNYEPDEDALWFWVKDATWIDGKTSGTIVHSNDETSRPISPQFKGRVNYTGSTRFSRTASPNGLPSCSISICGLTEQDRGQYFFRYIPKGRDMHKWKTNEAILQVTENPCPLTFEAPPPARETRTVTIICYTSCPSYPVINGVPPSRLKNSGSWNYPRRYTSTAEITASWKDDGREFTCETQINTNRQQKRISISVHYGPNVEVRVAARPPFTEGQSLTLTCEVLRSNPAPSSFTWSKNDEGLSSGQTLSLTLRPEDSGSYSCSAQNSVSTARSTSLMIQVQYKPRNTNIETVGQTETEIAAGRSVILKCKTEANPPAGTFYWFHDRNYLRMTSENSLELSSLQLMNEGCYTCRALNSVGQGSYSPDHCIKVLYPPSNLILSMESEVTEGQQVSITCTVSSTPATSLTLSQTSQGSTKVLQKTNGQGSLRFSFTASHADSGQYNCSAHNKVGSMTTLRSLTVKYGPKEVRVQAESGLMVKENMTLMLRCSAQSYPPVSSVSWSRVTAGQERHVHDGTVYTMKSVTENDSGLYRCTAHNPIGNGTSPTAEVQVKFGPRQALVLREPGPDGSRSVNLSCRSHSFPPANHYTWYRNTKGQMTIVSEKISLIVQSTEPGDYYCTAKNDVGESTSEPVSLFQPGHSLMFIILALVALSVIFCAFVLYRLKKKSAEERKPNNSWSRSFLRSVGLRKWPTDSTEDVLAEPHRRQDVPGGQPGSPSRTLCSADNLHKQNGPGTSGPGSDDGLLHYASLHFDKTKRTPPPEEPEDEVVYSTVRKPDQDVGDIYENVSKSQVATGPDFSDRSDDEVDVTYSKVNFKTKGQNRNRL